MTLFIKTFLYMLGIGDNPVPIESHSDEEAISSDWQNIGNDIRTALGKYGEQQSTAS